MTDAWTTKLRATRQLVNELRADVGAVRATNASSERDGDPTTKSSETARARALALARRKLNRLDDLLDVLDDCAREGARDDAEIEARERTVEEFQREARRLRGDVAKATETRTTTSATTTTTTTTTRELGANVSALGAAIGKGVSDAATSVSNAAGGLVASASRAAESVPALERAATMVIPSRKDEESRATRAMDTRELIEHQTAQIRGQDDALEGLDKLVENLKTTSEAIHGEVVLQAKLVEDLEADFSHTSDRMKKLRKQGFKLAGEKNEEERERLDRNEVIEEMRAKLGREQRAAESADGGCVVQ